MADTLPPASLAVTWYVCWLPGVRLLCASDSPGVVPRRDPSA